MLSMVGADVTHIKNLLMVLTDIAIYSINLDSDCSQILYSVISIIITAKGIIVYIHAYAQHNENFHSLQAVTCTLLFLIEIALG